MRAHLLAMLVWGVAVCLVRPGLAADDARPALSQPSISPDRREIAFVAGGDIWSVATAGGDARVLVDAGGYASRPLFSPDGKRIAYASSMPGARGIYVAALDGGAPQRLTRDETADNPSAWSPDGRYVYFESSAHNLGFDVDVMRVPADGGTPMRVVSEPYVESVEGVPSPGGGTVAYARDGLSFEWWRRGHAHIDESPIVTYDLASKHYATVSAGGARERWPMWSADGRTIYYVSDSSGTDELWSASGSTRRRLTSLHGEPVLWPTISRDGTTIAFEHALGVWTYDIASGRVQRVAIALRGVPATTPVRHLTLTRGFAALALAPDGKKVAFVAHGRIFAADATSGGDALRVDDRLGANDDLPVWAPDSRRIAYVVDRGRTQALAIRAFPDGDAQLITPPGHHDDYPHWSPDGARIAYVRDGRELHLFDVATKADRIAARGIFDRRPFGDVHDIAFSPAGDWLAFVDAAPNGFGNVMVVPTSGLSAPRAVSFVPDTNVGFVTWSADATRLYFVTSQRTENGQIAQVDLVPKAPGFREKKFRDLFREKSGGAVPDPAAASPKPATKPSAHESGAKPPRARIDVDNIRERFSLEPTGLDVTGLTVAPDGKTLAFIAATGAQQNVYALSVDETADEPHVAKQLTSTPSRKSDLAVAPDGKTAFVLDGGRLVNVPLEAAGAKTVAVSAEVDVDFAADTMLTYDSAWSVLDRWYADPRFHGADWEAVYRTYEPAVRAAANPADFERTMSLVVGEMNSSHMGFRTARDPSQPRFTLGRIGVEWDRAAYDDGGRLRVAQIVPLGPVALARGVESGDDLVAVDGRRVDAHTDVDALLEHTIGGRVVLRFARAGHEHDVVVQPVDTPAIKDAAYHAFIAERRAYVRRISGGRLGYVHVPDMSAGALVNFYRDLDVQNRASAGVIVDIRNNEGGFVDPYAIDVLTRREFVRFASRFGIDPPERTALGQRALDRPTALVVNAQSLSDAENFTEGYRRLHAGPVVGEPTAGWIIFTDQATFADGSVVRVPSTSVIARDGTNLELHPRPVDVPAAYPPGSAARGVDPQLDAAVATLLRRIQR